MKALSGSNAENNVNSGHAGRSGRGAKDDRRVRFGREGEEYAAGLVVAAGLTILARNYRCPKGEIDIIASDAGTLVFIEVRTRRSGHWGWGEESVTARKITRLQAVASYYLQREGYRQWPRLRFDVIALRWQVGEPDVNWVRNIALQ